MSKPNDDQIEWLKVVLAVVTLAALVLLYIPLTQAEPQNSLLKLIVNTLPSLVAVLIIAIVVYIIFTRKGITPKLIAQEVVKAMPTTVAGHDSELEERGVRDFYPNFRSIPWGDLISESRSIDIAVCYFDSWVKSNWESVEQFFARGGSMKVILPDPNSEEAMRVVQQRFPEYPVETIKFKVLNTGARLAEALNESHSRSARLEVHFYPSALNYSAIRFNGELVLLSVYEQFRREKIDSSAILLDLGKSDHLRQYWDKEFGGFVSSGRAEDIEAIKRAVHQLRNSSN